MNSITPGDLYRAERTDHNRMNGLAEGAECRIAHCDPKGISIAVVGKNNGSFPKLFVPIAMFGSNFVEERGAVINRSYVVSSPFTKLYR